MIKAQRYSFAVHFFSEKLFIKGAQALTVGSSKRVSIPMAQ
jgi:hypothetical protein